jgi:LysM repeat protein
MKHLILSLLFIISIFSASAFAQCTEGNCEDGQGTYKYSEGAIYKGQWKNSRLDGQGTLTYLDGRKYVGQWENNSYIIKPEGYETHKILPKKMAEKKSQKAESSKSSKVSEKTTNKRYHTVSAGETLYSISRRYGLPVKKIQLLNKLSDRFVIYPGQKLLVTL